MKKTLSSLFFSFMIFTVFSVINNAYAAYRVNQECTLEEAFRTIEYPELPLGCVLEDIEAGPDSDRLSFYDEDEGRVLFDVGGETVILENGSHHTVSETILVNMHEVKLTTEVSAEDGGAPATISAAPGVYRMFDVESAYFVIDNIEFKDSYQGHYFNRIDNREAIYGLVGDFHTNLFFLNSKITNNTSVNYRFYGEFVPEPRTPAASPGLKINPRGYFYIKNSEFVGNELHGLSLVFLEALNEDVIDQKIKIKNSHFSGNSNNHFGYNLSNNATIWSLIKLDSNVEAQDTEITIDNVWVDGNTSHIEDGFTFGAGFDITGDNVDVVVKDSTFNHNKADANIVDYYSDAVAYGVLTLRNISSAKIQNSTFTGNSTNDNRGGAISVFGVDRLNLTHNTIVENSARRGPGIFTKEVEQGEFFGNLIAYNEDTDGGDDYNDDCFWLDSSISSLGYNLVRTCRFLADYTVTQSLENLINASLLFNNTLHSNVPMYYGAPTHALVNGSEAIGRIPREDCVLDKDQRGHNRINNGNESDRCDIGAVDFETSVGNLNIYPRVVDFGSVDAGDAVVNSRTPVTVRNEGLTTYEITNLNVVDRQNEFSQVPPTDPAFCTVGTVLNPGAACLLLVQFKPIDHGFAGGTLDIELDSSFAGLTETQSEQIELRGEGVLIMELP